MYYSTCPSPVGVITLACDGESLVGLWLEGQKYHGESISGALAEKDDLPIFYEAKEWLDRYFDGKMPDASELPLAPAGSAFRQKVWHILRKIPYGEIITYGDIAKQIAKNQNKASAYSRAVGGAVGHNPISIIIPCHRVVGSGGSLTGYAGGIQKKKSLLELEGADLAATC
ncbi:MAG: methylated-DNA--[protein]-cysteine S-methyltransferase [Oscillospiraceae bacterium]|nr:methylated-DNA--[protein]-cysteine S-methyltransferase [Oscillospiraceae bacterium]